MSDSQKPGKSNEDEFEDLDVLSEQFADDSGEVEPIARPDDGSPDYRQDDTAHEDDPAPEDTDREPSAAEAATSAAGDDAETPEVEAVPEAGEDEVAEDAAAEAAPTEQSAEQADEGGDAEPPSRGWSLSEDFGADEVPVATEGEPFWLDDDGEVPEGERHDTAILDSEALTAQDTAEQPVIGGASEFSDTAMIRDITGDYEVVGVESAEETGIVDLPAADPQADEADAEPPIASPAYEQPTPQETAGLEAAGTEPDESTAADDETKRNAEFDALIAEPQTTGEDATADDADSASWNQLETGAIEIDPAALGAARAEFESLQQNVTAEHQRLRDTGRIPSPPAHPSAPVEFIDSNTPQPGPPALPYSSPPREHGAEQVDPEEQQRAEPVPSETVAGAPHAGEIVVASPSEIERAQQPPPAPTQQELDEAERERQAILHPAEPDTEDELAQAAINRVRSWIGQRNPNVKRDPAAERLAGLLQDPDGLQFAMRFIDRVVRVEDKQVAAREFERLSRRVPGFLEWYLKFAISMGGGFGLLFPSLVIPMAKKALRRLVSHLVIDASSERLGKKLTKLRADGSRLNINLLGEAVLGEQEAQRRLDGTLQLLSRPDVDYVSIKVSSLAPQLNLWGFEETAERVAARLMPLYRVAAEAAPAKFINLDMEEYHDLDLTIEVFKRILANPELQRLEAGIVLQAYLPDALPALEHLTEWARARVAAGGAGIKVRVVKGANLAMERVDAVLHGWPQATVGSKTAADANYKRVLEHALRPENAGIVRIGVGGHNLFDLAYAIELASRNGVSDHIDIEMLLGMASEYVEAIRSDIPRVVVYTPVVHPRDFDAAVAYLVRRLEENADNENFMRRAFEVGSQLAAFELERDRFLSSLKLLREIETQGPPATNRQQNRGGDLTVAVADAAAHTEFFNEPDTDASLAANRRWGTRILERASDSELGLGTLKRNLIDDVPTMERRIRKIVDAAPGWRARGAEGRRGILLDAAVTLGAYRGRLIEVMAAETGKTIAQGDTEVSEAIDFCRYYGDAAVALEGFEHAKPKPVDMTVVVPPWNFPTAIPCGGVVSALATGSTVVIKPARNSRRTAAVLCEALWEAGVPRDVLVFCDIEDREVARHLIAHESVGRLILTGSSETAELFSSWRPGLPILAETSGKNGIVITPAADFDLAVEDLVQSAFGHAGQKCSAASLAILVGSVASSERFRRQLIDAVQSMRVGYPTDAQVHMGPIIEPAHGKLERALTTLEDGESWLIEPRRLNEEGTLWSPGVRIGVRPGSYTHLTEFFGPHLSIIEVPTLAAAIEVQNGTDFGLTAGIHSLDVGQVAEWLEGVEAGNLYVNRGITGAIVRRQPFGGWKLSQVGPGAKAGGPNYLTTLVDWEPVFERPRDHVRLVGLSKSVATVIEAATPQLDFLEFDRVRAGANSDQRAWEHEYGVSRDVSKLAVERNVFRYRPTNEVLVRLSERGTVGQLIRVLAAATRAGAAIRVSSAKELPPHVVSIVHMEDPPLLIEQVVIESDADFRARIDSGDALAPITSTDDAGAERAGAPVRRIRLIGGDDQLVEQLAGNVRVALYDAQITTEGRLELLPFLREQAVSVTCHRYGTPDREMLTLDV
ncbi:proline dehydrogenase family protein [uncultured Agrococcus sp.]|uniref:proline dehydrogenase family protein n=1 Tax=uncultured Agrococcus sp. TaxID=382258 RepID=UPI0025F80AC8|nr:proline dehydrogenase family protein [uncultured Agrococcus sp.]